MKLVKCRKCGTAIMTDDSLLENMVEEMNECNRLSRKAKTVQQRNAYLQQASQLKKMITQIQHRTTEMETRSRSGRILIGKLKQYVLENNLMTTDQIEKFEKDAALEVAIGNKKDGEVIESVYGSYHNSMANRTNKDTTARTALKGM